MLTLDGADPQLRFGSLGNRAVVTASCESAAASVHWVEPRCVQGLLAQWSPREAVGTGPVMQTHVNERTGEPFTNVFMNHK